MLTKDLIKCKVRAGKLKPQFIDADSLESKALAGNLLSEFSDFKGKSKKDVDHSLAENFDVSQLEFLGLKKLIIDKCRWKDDDGVIRDTRWTWLSEAQKLRDRLDFSDIESYQSAISSHLDRDFENISQNLFADLPENRLLLEFSNYESKELLERYNTALVQGLLLKANSMRLKIKKISLVQKRSLFRNLKFHQLMVKVNGDEAIEKKSGDLDITIDGPLNLFQKTSVYGTKFANFFPHILNLEKWELIAELEWKKKTVELKLTEKNNLVSHYRVKGGYIPAEFDTFVSSFNKEKSGWEAGIGADFLDVGSQSFCFPDFEFQKTGEKSIALELFHKWHQGQLIDRLNCMQKNPNKSLIIGVCRKVAKQKDVSEAIANSKLFQQNGLLFSDFPTPNSVKKLLKTSFSEG